MPYKDGTWGDQAKQRAQGRSSYFLTYKQRRDPVKVKARNAVYRAVKTGKLQKLPCKKKSSECRGRIEGDHCDYTKPLEVTWLCSFHHLQKEISRKKKTSKASCLSCGDDIFYPKKKYCSDKCGQFNWRKENHR